MKKKLNIIPKNKKCKCGKKVTHHHFLCNECWREENLDRKLRRNAMKKNAEGKNDKNN